MRARQQMILRDDRVIGAAGLAPYQPMVPMMAAGHAAPEVPETSMFRAIFRHFWMVVFFALLGAGGAYAYCKYAIPMYSSVCTLEIKPSSNVRLLSDTLGSAQRSNYLYTQATLIMSTPILNMVAERPEIKNLKTFSRLHVDPIRYMKEELIADVDRKTDLISVSIETPYPEESVAIVKAAVDSYTKYQNIDRATVTSGPLKAIENQLADARKELTKAQDAVAEFLSTHPAVTVTESTAQNELATWSAQWTQARIETINAKATYAPGHPNVQRALEKEEQAYDAYHQQLEKVMKANVTLRDFQQLATTLQEKKQFVDQLSQRIMELQLGQKAEAITNNVQTYEDPVLAEKPSSPRPKRTMAVAILAGALLGAGLALFRDKMDGRMRSVEEIQTVVGLPILGVVPAMSGRRTAVARAMTVHLDPRSVVAEAYRTIRTAVYFGTNGSRCKTMLVTSPEPGDGKTTSASNLAIAIAQTGRTVLLLDADFRKPTQHKNLDIKNSIGLSSVLAGSDTLERAIQRTGVEGLDILPCGPIPANPSEILNSREFSELIDSLASRYDHILFDSPPVNPVTDSRILAAVCDATVLVLRADKSTRKSGEHARNALLAVGARVLGAIVNDAPNKKGYEVYGGSYYGSADPGPRQPDGRDGGSAAFRRLPTPVGNTTE